MSQEIRLRTLSPPNEVVDRVLSALRIKPNKALIHIDKALNRIAAENVYAKIDIPPHNRAVIDGYATLYSSIEGSIQTNPSRLTIVGKIEINELPPSNYLIKPGEAIEVATGSPLPANIDVVIPYEYTQRISNQVLVFKEFPPKYGISYKGEDIRKGEIIVSEGEIIRPWHIALMASQGINKVKVFNKLRSVVLSIGSELIEPGEKLRTGFIYDSTRYLVKNYLRTLGLEVKDLGIIGDDPEEIRRHIVEAMDDYDIVFTIGGTSVGEKDYTVRVLKNLNPTILIHGFALKPGRPGAIAVFNKIKLVMALSGFPVAALAELEAIFKPIYAKIMKIKGTLNPIIKAKLAKRIPSEPGIMEIYRVKVCLENNEYKVYPLKLTGSGILSTLIKANGLLIIPADVTGYDKGDIVEVELIGDISECKM